MFTQKITAFLFIASSLAIFAYAANDVSGFKDSMNGPQSTSFNSQVLNRTNAEDQSGLIGFTVNGQLEEYGNIGGDGTFNYRAQKNNQTYGGGFNIGTTDLHNSTKQINGIGGGYTFNKTNVDIGAGINAFNQKVNFHLDIQKNNQVIIEFDVSGTGASSLHCVPNNQGAVKGMKCTTSLAD